MELNVDIDEIVLHGVAHIDRQRLVAQIERRLQHRLRTEGLPDFSADATSLASGPVDGSGSEDRRSIQQIVSPPAGSSRGGAVAIGDSVADALWSSLQRAAREAR